MPQLRIRWLSDTQQVSFLVILRLIEVAQVEVAYRQLLVDLCLVHLVVGDESMFEAELVRTDRLLVLLHVEFTERDQLQTFALGVRHRFI